MDRQEKVRKILELVKTNECSVGRATHQICSLFEPKPEKSCTNELCEHNAWNSKECYDCGWTEAISDIASREATTKPKTIIMREGLVEEMWQSGERVMHDQREAIRAKTLKEVGEWLGKQHCIKTDSHNATVILLKSDIQSLQKGEMPK